MENIPHLTLQETRPPAKGLSHLKMLMQSYEIYYDWITDGLSTDWLGWKREKNYIFIVDWKRGP